ncbi:MAG: hydantoinase/oxoprolinase family protein [Pseudomonadota bacterium]
MTYALAIDIGGTFTDAVLVSSDGNAWTDKTLTTHDDLLEGLFRGAELVLGKAGVSFADVDDIFAHATTVITNVLIERKGAPTALITTQGFKDVLYIRDEHRYDMFDPQLELPEPLITADLTWGVDERTFSDGTIGKTVNAADLLPIAEEMKKAGVQSVAICLLNSYANPQNERAIKTALSELMPDAVMSLSCEVAPQMREYLRTSTTAVNAYAMPTAQPYLRRLVKELKQRDQPRTPLIMMSNGGVVGAGVAGQYPVRMIESGPAAGALIASFFAEKYNFESLMSFDMGGTTAKACLIQDGEPLVSGEFEVDRRYRFKPGSGMPITVPSIDMIEIGAGGGSIARVDYMGLLKVGPDSAGSSPGPACYGRGGENACVTDADLALGILDADNFLGGDMKLDKGASQAAIAKLADGLNVSVSEAAWGIYAIVGESMAGAARAHATDRGINYRGVPLLAFGGAGPVHACYVAEQLESTQIIYPPMASVLSAYGTLVTPARLDLARSNLTLLADVDGDHVSGLIDEMVAESQDALVDAGVEAGNIIYAFSADMRYGGQQSEITVTLPHDPRETIDERAIKDAFEKTYETFYGLTLEGMEAEIVSWRVTATAGDQSRNVIVPMAAQETAPKSTRDVYIAGQSHDVSVYDRLSLKAGQQLQGPVLIEERETTIFVLPGWTVEALEDGALSATRENEQA